MCHQGMWARVGAIGTYKKILAPLESNYKFALTSNYKEWSIYTSVSHDIKSRYKSQFRDLLITTCNLPMT